MHWILYERISGFAILLPYPQKIHSLIFFLMFWPRTSPKKHELSKLSSGAVQFVPINMKSGIHQNGHVCYTSFGVVCYSQFFKKLVNYSISVLDEKNILNEFWKDQRHFCIITWLFCYFAWNSKTYVLTIRLTWLPKITITIFVIWKQNLLNQIRSPGFIYVFTTAFVIKITHKYHSNVNLSI